MSSKICRIVGAGEFERFSFDKSDFIIAADGGYDHLKKINVKPNILLGDFDSIKSIPGNEQKKIKFDTQKDFTDLYAAIQIGIKSNCKIFHIYGALGKRFDHSLANIQLLAYLSQNKFHAFLHHKKKLITAITNTKISFGKNKTGTISIFSYTNKSYGVNIINLKYELKDAVLSNTFPLGVSNEFIKKKSFVSVRKGTLIVVF